jgi:heme/copper-type cytochrome/quinol oxidase subunit 4
MLNFPALVYLLCLLSSVLCLVLLARGYLRTRVKLLFWSACCFVGLALNNLFLFLDTIVFPDMYLMPMRLLTTGTALVVLLYGFIWEVD